LRSRATVLPPETQRSHDAGGTLLPVERQPRPPAVDSAQAFAPVRSRSPKTASLSRFSESSARWSDPGLCTERVTLHSEPERKAFRPPLTASLVETETHLRLLQSAVEHFQKLRLAPADTDHRRVLAVLRFFDAGVAYAARRVSSPRPWIKPSRQLGYRSCQPSSRLAFAFEAPRPSVTIVASASPAMTRPTHSGT
jgi:hypothetical protein